jgi:hypothetical protein
MIKLMQYRRTILKDAFTLAHQPGNKIGVWWYRASNGELEYSTEAQGHLDQRFSLRQQAGKDKTILRGRLFAINNKIWLIVYSSPYSRGHLPVKVLNDLRTKVEAVSCRRADFIVNEKGETIR